MAKKKQDEPKAGTMEKYIWQLLHKKEREFADIAIMGHGQPERPVMFYTTGAQIDILYMILTGHSNPLSNPEKMIKVIARNETEFLFLPLPKDADRPWVVNNGDEQVALNYYIPDKTFSDERMTMSDHVRLPSKKSFELIACTDTITEQQADSIVEKLHYITDKPYKNYVVGDNTRCWKAVDSFITLLRANRISGKYAVLREVR